MAKLKKKRSSIISRLRIYFFAGIVVLVPLGFIVYLTIFLISISSKLIPEARSILIIIFHFAIPGLEIVLSILFITIVGGLSLSFIGRKILKIFNELLKKVPILRTIYSAIGQMTKAFTQKKGRQKKKCCFS